jgi:hypothetical protein
MFKGFVAQRDIIGQFNLENFPDPAGKNVDVAA